MDKNQLTPTVVVVIVVIIAIIFCLLGYRTFSGNRTHIVLPPETTSAEGQGTQSGEDNTALVAQVEIDTANVQDVIATLQRPTAYSRTITVTTLWSGGSGTQSTDVKSANGWTRMDTTLSGGQIRHVLMGEEKTYIWYNGTKTYHVLQTGDFSSDDEQSIPSYESLLREEPGQIAQADYENYQNIPCVYVQTATDENGNFRRYWISVESGLLIAAERVQNDSVFYRMEALTVDLGEPAASAFTLPDGTVLPQ